MKRVQQGFTLIELMIVVAIIGILAAIAIPQYQDYVTRARWADAVTSIGSLKAAIGECAQNNNNTLTECDSVTKLNGFGITAEPATKFTNTAVTIITGTAAIQIASTNNQLGSCTVVLTPSPISGNITWGSSVTGTNCTKAKTGFGT
jgi:type IV pilus assembly protein PilA